MIPRFLSTLVAALLGAGLVVSPGVFAQEMDPHADDPPPKNLPLQSLKPEWLMQFLVAEMAGHRGQIALAASAYRDLAKQTRDPRVARRSAEIAMFSRNPEAALDQARLWSELEPDSLQARQMLASLLASTNRYEELAGHVGKLLAAEGKNVGAALMRLPRIFARSPDKQTLQILIDQVTAPYLGIAEAHFVRALAAFDAQDAFRARAEAERTLALRPDWEQAALLRAQVTPRSPEVAEALREFIAGNPGAKEARIAYARALVADKRYEDARKEFSALLAANPDNADVIYAVAVLSLQLNDIGPAETHLKRLVELGYAESSAARVYLGQIAEERKRWDEAAGWYGQINAGDPQYLQAQLRLAFALNKQGRMDDARRSLQRASAANPHERAQLLVGEAQLLREIGRHLEAFKVLDDALANFPNQPELLYEAALAAEKAGKPDVLERYLRQLLKMRPDHAHAMNALGYSLADRNERLDEALQLIDKALQILPDDPFIIDSRGWALFRKGDTTGALAALSRAYGLRADPEIAAHLGEVLWVLGRKDEAKKTWNEASKANPENELLGATIRRFTP
jgi:tetratricopeptide (TPR) repeat protein